MSESSEEMRERMAEELLNAKLFNGGVSSRICMSKSVADFILRRDAEHNKELESAKKWSEEIFNKFKEVTENRDEIKFILKETETAYHEAEKEITALKEKLARAESVLSIIYNPGHLPFCHGCVAYVNYKSKSRFTEEYNLPEDGNGQLGTDYSTGKYIKVVDFFCIECGRELDKDTRYGIKNHLSFIEKYSRLYFEAIKELKGGGSNG